MKPLSRRQKIAVAVGLGVPLLVLLATITYAAMPSDMIGSGLLQLLIAVMLSVAVSLGAIKITKDLDQKKKYSRDKGIRVPLSIPLSGRPEVAVREKRFALPALAGVFFVIVICLLYATRRDPWLYGLILQSTLAAVIAVAFGYFCLHPPLLLQAQSLTILSFRHSASGGKWVFRIATSVAAMVVGAALFLTVSALAEPTFRDQRAFTALIYTEEKVSRDRDLFSTPTQQLQEAYFAKYSTPQLNILEPLLAHRPDLPAEAMNNAALVSFASENYELADRFVSAARDKGDQNNPQLWNIIGLLNLKRGLLEKSLGNFETALNALSSSSAPEPFKAAVLANKAVAESRLGREEEAEKSFDSSMKLLPQEGRPRIYIAILDTKLQLDTDDLSQADEIYAAALKSAEGKSDEKGQLFRQYSEVMFLRGESSKSEAFIKRAVELHESTENRLQLAKDLDQAGQIKLDYRSPKEALANFTRAGVYYQQLGYREGTANNDLLQAQAFIYLGDFEAAERLISEGDQLLHKLGCKLGIAQAAFLGGQAKFNEGIRPEFNTKLLDAAEQSYNAALVIFQEIGYKRGIADVNKSFCTLETERNRHTASQAGFSKAEKICEEDIKFYQEIGFKRGVADATGNLGILYHETGRLKQAGPILQKALADDQEIQFQLGEGRQYGNLGRLEISKKDKDAALVNFEKACDIFDKLQAAGDLAGCTHYRDCIKDAKDANDLANCDTSANATRSVASVHRKGSANYLLRSSFIDRNF